MGLIQEIGSGPVALDSVIFIYFIEEHPKYLPLVGAVFSGIDAERWQGVTSTITLLETLVVPYRRQRQDLAERYELLLSRSKGLRAIEIDRPLLRDAAKIRASLSIRTPDALQVAAALTAGCSCLLTNDRDLPEIPGLKVLQLEQYLNQSP